MIEKLQQLSNIKLEYNVLSYLLNNVKGYYNLPSFYSENLFFNENNRKISKVILETIKELDVNYNKSNIDLNLLIRNANKHGVNMVEISEIQVKYYDSNFIYNLQILKELEIKRGLVELMQLELNKIDYKNDVFDNISNITKTVTDLQNISTDKDISFNAVMERHKKELESKVDKNLKGEKYGIATGYRNLDNFVLGWTGGNLIILAARPSIGKTAMSLHFVNNAAKVNSSVLLMSLEMSEKQIADRFMLIQGTSFNSYQLRSGDLKDEALVEVSTHYRDSNFMDRKIYIDDVSGYNESLHIDNISLKIRKHIDKNKIDVVFIDYLSLIKHSENNNNIGYGVVTKELKSIAKQYDIDIILLTQLNRNLTNRAGNKQPQLQDLRDSGEIEQDADIVLFLHRPMYYGIDFDSNGESTEGLLEILIAKNRNGATGEIKLNHTEGLRQVSEFNGMPF